MQRFFKADIKSIVISVAWFVGLYQVTGWAAKAVYEPDSNLNDVVIDFLTLLPFLAAGFLASIRSHPSGVFNSAIVGALSGVLVAIFMRIGYDGFSASAPQSINIAAAMVMGMVFCSVGGVFGGIGKYLLTRRARNSRDNEPIS